MGYLGLCALRGTTGAPEAHLATRIAQGALLGWALLYATLRLVDGLTGSLDLLATYSILLVLGLVSLGLARRFPEQGAPAISPGGYRWLTALVIAWLCLHMTLALIEILHLPVYPWDAWLNWVYRAKAWYYANAIVPMAPVTEWTDGVAYSVAGHHYPTFLSTITAWTAMTTGHWSETLVKLPSFLCASAILLGIYGHCRQLQLGRLEATICAYLLASLPLLGTHLALAGQADLWMAAYTGLGFTTLLLGAYQKNTHTLCAGLACIAFSALVKLEGMVWLLVALLVVACIYRPRRVVGMGACAALVIGIAAVTGITLVHIPGLGPVGISESVLHLPVLGERQLVLHNLGDDFAANFFSNGTWHLLWPLVIAGSLVALARNEIRVPVWSFLTASGLAMFVIFQFTESGEYAEDWTAINRLPLHFVPALVFCLALAYSASARQAQQWKRTGIAALAGLVLCAATGLILIQGNPGPGANEAARTFEARSFRAVVGHSRYQSQGAVIDRYDNGVAILSSGPIAIQAEQLSLARFNLGGNNYSEPAFFWRAAGLGRELQTTWLPGPGDHWLDLADHPEWRGTIVEIGMVFYAHQEREARLHNITLFPHSLARTSQKLLDDWLTPNYWTQASVHYLEAGAPDSAVPLPLAALCWLLFSATLLVVLQRDSTNRGASIIFCCLLAWFVLDLRWTGNRLAQAQRTTAEYPLMTAEHLALESDRATHAVIAALRPQLEAPPQRLLIAADDPAMRFEMLRAKYHALPVAAHVHEQAIATAPLSRHSINQLLVLHRQRAGTDYQPSTAADTAAHIRGIRRTGSAVIAETGGGYLIAVPEKARFKP